MKNSKGLIPIVIVGVIFIIAAALVASYWWYQQKQQDLAIANTAQQLIADFDSCAAAGNPIMESYPRQCSANGKTYVENTNTNTVQATTQILFNGEVSASCSKDADCFIVDSTHDYSECCYPGDCSDKSTAKFISINFKSLQALQLSVRKSDCDAALCPLYESCAPLDSEYKPKCVNAICQKVWGTKKAQSESTTCNTNSDCELRICSGCFNKEYLKTAPPDLACQAYVGRTCTCQNNICAVSMPSAANTNSAVGCRHYFDGCNGCTRNDAGVATCTTRYCKPDEYEPFRCLDNENTNTVANTHTNNTPE